ncbi:MAG: CHASE3 domain-containing protein [Armatimonadetes bacterium]|nr:CHASE3 domain-containing protein [Armatimonadota bacterium]
MEPTDPKSSLRSVFAAVAALLVVCFIAVFLAGGLALASAEEGTAHSRTSRLLEVVLSRMRDMETGQRGYLITGEAGYLQPYREASSALAASIEDFKATAEKTGVPAADVDKLTGLISAKRAELLDTVETHDREGRDAAVRRVQSGKGKALMDEIRAVVQTLQAQQQRLMDKNAVDLARLTVFRTVAFGVVTALSLVALASAYRRIGRETARRYEAAKETVLQKNLLEVTLASIGDGVIVTDTAGRVTFLNAVANDLTGWGQEAVGRPCAEVFDIVNEETRLPVESPVDKVIRSGVVVGLANHTVLIKKDKSELPIDDSGAPIKDADDVFHGVVLVFRDFSEHKRAQKELKAAKDHADIASLAKDRFIASLSHELRTPLTPVIALLSSWQSDPTFPESRRGDVDLIRRSLDLESRLIDDLLDLSKIIQGKLSIAFEPTDLHQVLTWTLELCTTEAEQRGVALRPALLARSTSVQGDQARLHQVFWNIVRNAVKFSEPGAEVRIETRDLDGGQIEITVSDDGFGMDVETLDNLFEPFQQGAGASRFGGLGLGLSISKGLVLAHGGEIFGSSDGPGKGSKIKVVFPVRSATTFEHAPGGVVDSATEVKPLRVLLVEDHVDTATIVARLFEESGYRISVAHDVAGAITMVEGSGPFDVMISDVGLPDGTGYDLLARIRSSEAGQGTLRAVALTGYGMDEDVRRCREAGFDEHLTKPVDFTRLLKTVVRLGSGEAD